MDINSDWGNKIKKKSFLFSHWLFTWFIFYIGGIIPYSPKILFLFALGGVLCFIVYFIWQGISKKKLAIFCAINLVIKGIPLAWMWHEKIHYSDIGASIVFIIIYLAWISFHGTDVIKIYKGMIQTYSG